MLDAVGAAREARPLDLVRVKVGVRWGSGWWGGMECGGRREPEGGGCVCVGKGVVGGEVTVLRARARAKGYEMGYE